MYDRIFGNRSMYKACYFCYLIFYSCILGLFFYEILSFDDYSQYKNFHLFLIRETDDLSFKYYIEDEYEVLYETDGNVLESFVVLKESDGILKFEKEFQDSQELSTSKVDKTEKVEDKEDVNVNEDINTITKTDLLVNICFGVTLIILMILTTK